MNAAAPAVVVRVMEPADIGAATRLREQAGWNQTPADWQRLLAWEPGGCFVAEVAGRVVGTVTTTTYGARLAWIGMLLVDAAMRQRGIGRALLARALDYLERTRAVQTVALDATPLGQPLYRRMGFVAAWALRRWVVQAPVTAQPPAVCPMQPADLAALVALDRVAFGVERRRLLADLFAAHPSGCFHLAETDSWGYICSRPGEQGWYLGPLVASDVVAAEQLLRAALHPLRGETVILDALVANPAATTLLRTLGFAPQRPLLRMYRGAVPPPAEVGRYFGIAGLEIG